MLESKHFCHGWCKTDSRCPKKSLNVTNCSRILQSRSDSRTDLKTIRNWMSRSNLAWQLRLADQKTSQGNILQRSGRNLCIVYPGLEEKSYELTYFQKFPNLTTWAIHSNEYSRTEGYNYYTWDNSKRMVELGLLCNIEDLDFNRAIYSTT